MFIWSKTFFFLDLSFFSIRSPAVAALLDFCYKDMTGYKQWESILGFFFLQLRIIFVSELDTNKQKMKHTLRATWKGWITLQESFKNAMVFRHTLLSELLQVSVLVEKRSFSSQDVVTGRRLQCLSIHMRNACKSSEYCCCEILTDRRLHIPICSGLNAVPHPHKEYAHILTPRARSSLEKMPSWV